MKRVIRFAAAGSFGLIVGTATAGLCRDDFEPNGVNPSCHPTYGYHQTCWRQFPLLPPCNVCQECRPDGAVTSCDNGNCQPSQQPATIPLSPQPQTVQSPGVPAGAMTGRYGTPSPGPMPSSTPMQNSVPVQGSLPLQTATPLPGMSSGMSRYGSPPQTVPAGPVTGGRYQTVPSAVPPAPVGGVPATGAPAGLPPVPGTAPRSSGLYIPAQSMALPGGGRYGGVSAASSQGSVRTATQTRLQPATSAAGLRYPVQPRSVSTQLLAAPLLRRPGTR